MALNIDPKITVTDTRRPAEQVFAENMRTLREDADMSQEALAKELTARGFPWGQATVYKVESGSRNIKLGEARAIADVFNVPLQELTDGQGDVAELAKLRKAVDGYRKMADTLRRMSETTESVRRSVRRRAGLDLKPGESPSGAAAMLSDAERDDIDRMTGEG